tara:strand:+ start:618 stop:1016 length:399 start_codon:yes stop_codon:yes gene_type:complete
VTQDSDQIAKVIFIKDDRVLLLLRGMQSRDPFSFDVPGGHLHVGETAKAAAVREVKEETDLSLREEDLRFIEKIGRTTYFKAQSWEGKIYQPPNFTEHETYLWLNLQDITFLERNIIPRRHFSVLTRVLATP